MTAAEASAEVRALAGKFVARWRDHYRHLAEDYPIWSKRHRPDGVDGLQWLGVRLLEAHYDEWAAEIVAKSPPEGVASPTWTIQPLGHDPDVLQLVPLHVAASSGARAVTIGPGSPWIVLVGRETAPYYALYKALQVILPENTGKIGAARERKIAAAFVAALARSVVHPDQEQVRKALFREGYFLRLSRLRRGWRQARTSMSRKEPRKLYSEARRQFLDRVGLEYAAGAGALEAIGLGSVTTRRASAQPVTDISDIDVLRLFDETRLLVDEIRDYDARPAHHSRQKYLVAVWTLTHTSSYPTVLRLPREDKRRYHLNKQEFALFKRWCLRLRFPLLTHTEIEIAVAPAKVRGRLRATYSLLLHRLGLDKEARDSLKYLIRDIKRR